jgi:Zn-dependent protease with chaperone function
MAGTSDGAKAPSLAGRFAAAIALTIGFYTLALAVAAALIGGPIYGWVEAGRGNIFVTIFGIVTGVSILVAIFPRRMPFTPPGPRIDASDQPRMMAAVDEVARDLRQDMPSETYVTFEVNAAVTEVANGFLRGRRRVLIIGLPLLHVLSERGFRGVLAHEFGHYAGGDTRLGPWIWRTRETIGRTIEHLSVEDEDDDSWANRAVRAPFIWYGKAFLRITNTISRRQEFAADAVAAREVGRDAYAEALRRLHALGPGFDAFWADEVVPALSSGFRPPVLAGFSGFLGTEGVQRSAAAYLEHQLAEARSDPYDSHPALPERLAAIERCPGGAPDDSPPASALLEGEAALEQRTLAELGAGELEPMRWEEAGDRVWLAHYRELLADHGALLGDATVDDLAGLARDPAPIVSAVRRDEPEVPKDAATAFAHRLLFSAFAVAAVRAGWALEATPGEPVAAVSGERRFLPAELLADASDGKLSAEEWRERMADLGLAGAPLAAAEPAHAAG